VSTGHFDKSLWCCAPLGFLSSCVSVFNRWNA